MSRDFDAIYTQGHLVPLEPLELREQERVRVRLEPIDDGIISKPDCDFSTMSFRDALAASGLLGSIRGEPVDLSTNPKFMEGFGEHERDPA